MLFLLLVACYDKVVIHAHIDQKADVALGESREVNAWQRAIVCSDVLSCQEAIQKEVGQQMASLAEQGAKSVAGGIQLHDGELDVVMRWTMPLSTATWANQTFLLVYDQPARGWIGGANRRARLGFVWQEDRGTRVTVDKAPCGTRAWTLPDSPIRHGLIFPGKQADLDITFTTLDDAGNPAHEAGWIRGYPGLEDALRATPGLLLVD